MTEGVILELLVLEGVTEVVPESVPDFEGVTDEDTDCVLVLVAVNDEVIEGVTDDVNDALFVAVTVGVGEGVIVFEDVLVGVNDAVVDAVKVYIVEGVTICETLVELE